MFPGLRDLLGFGGGRPPPAAGRSHIIAEQRPARLYAIGDIHGCLAELQALEQMIIADAAGVEGEKWIVTLGDYIDRGPASAQVLAHLMGPPPQGFKRISLAGNHEQMLLDFLAAPRRNQGWLDYGGVETARSYGLATPGMKGGPPAIAQALRTVVPAAHLAWIGELPIALAVPGYTFVHAGLRPGIPLDRQADEDLLWIRDTFLAVETPGDTIVVHGHTPETEAITTPCRIGIDTAAYATGRLTALRLDHDGAVSFLRTR